MPDDWVLGLEEDDLLLLDDFFFSSLLWTPDEKMSSLGRLADWSNLTLELVLGRLESLCLMALWEGPLKTLWVWEVPRFDTPWASPSAGEMERLCLFKVTREESPALSSRDDLLLSFSASNLLYDLDGRCFLEEEMVRKDPSNGSSATSTFWCSSFSLASSSRFLRRLLASSRFVMSSLSVSWTENCDQGMRRTNNQC